MLRFWETVGDGKPDSISWAKPRIALSGVRNSWLMLDRKSDFAKLAFSATALASAMAASTCLLSVRSRVSLAYPRKFPAWSRIAVHATFAQKADPSLRTR